MGAFARRRPDFSSPRTILLLVRIWSFVSILPLLLRLCGLPQLLRLCTPRKGRWPPDAELVIACIDFVLGRQRWIYRNTCLNRSLTLYRFLGGAATNLEICFGVRYEDGLRGDREVRRLQGHAWLRRNGEVYLEPDAHLTQTFSVVYRHPTTQPWTA